ncbi:MAG: DNA mismatch repair protein MutT [Marinosulfonomonas sp.]|nr:MAG: DNA mismatch repair protein MutT [Marinosulfonomonas sp.]
MDFHGAKLALISGGHVLTLLRDDKPDIPFRDMWDFPGGGREGDETPKACVLRELWEEFGLRLSQGNLIYGAHRDGVLEGQGWEMMPIETYLSHPRAIPHLQDGLRGFLGYLGQGK